MATNTMPTLSSLELMLQELQKKEELPKDAVPALPTRPVIRARLPRSRTPLLPFISQISACEDNGNQYLFEEDGKRDECGVFNGSVYHQKSSVEVEGEKIGNFGDGKEASVQQTLGIQTHLDKGVITLQSFIRGENAQKHFARKKTAIAVIQKHVKLQLRRRLLEEEEEDQAIIYLQASIRGWLAWRHFNSIDRREKQLKGDAKNMKNLEKKDQVLEVPYSVLLDLQRRVLKTEALLDKKKEENASLRLQIKQLERKRQQFETKMKSMEKTWQDQLTSMQASLAAAAKKDSKCCAGKLGMLFALPENLDEDGVDSDSPLHIRSRMNSDIDHRKAMSDENAGIMIQNDAAQEDSSIPSCNNNNNNPEVELQKLKLKFKTWKKDFRNRMVVAKTKIKKFGNGNSLGGEKNSNHDHKKWWGR